MALPDRAVCVVLDADGAVLVVDRFCDGRRYCVLPGGGVEECEQPAAAALRELWEETGLTGSIAGVLGTHQHAGRQSHYYLVTLADLGMTRPKLAAQSPECERQSDTNQYSPGWLPVGDLASRNLQPVEARDLVARAVGGVVEGRL